METPAQEQARLRRERRAAKLQSGGSARLDAITRLSGRSGSNSPAPEVHDTPVAGMIEDGQAAASTRSQPVG